MKTSYKDRPTPPTALQACLNYEDCGQAFEPKSFGSFRKLYCSNKCRFRVWDKKNARPRPTIHREDK